MHFQSVQQFKATFWHCIKDYNFAPGTLMLIHNSCIEKELNQKMKLQHTGPMVILCQTTGGSYLLAELDGSISKLCFTVFHLLPYHPQSQAHATVTHITRLDNDELDHLLKEAEDDPTDNEVEVFALDSQLSAISSTHSPSIMPSPSFLHTCLCPLFSHDTPASFHGFNHLSVASPTVFIPAPMLTGDNRILLEHLLESSELASPTDALASHLVALTITDDGPNSMSHASKMWNSHEEFQQMGATADILAGP
ncbi:hypothetical protein M404DRAFT_29158 [Pisolithus tinctorius Marx 270]|uniref:Uncharacterized protein n=1 Tax=Pisolithus tinctorius Marx 270 TaxID=870435 RepID=A0A0C3P0T8_PISTI|nr:hypothetical protein M404DRAFT_29158 [Pisolithus tinctorius Marx 270]